ncbi:hypothetical protein GCM10009765_02820 [Fodinicola feengrottensis]|uniref:Peptidase M28 domain-containing protein n=2 Tax=Fodinicola feengrottensis TaxID=435914 RepID=A0ABP4RR14_9ACTN
MLRRADHDRVDGRLLRSTDLSGIGRADTDGHLLRMSTNALRDHLAARGDVSVARLRSTVARLSGNEFTGRRVGTAGGLASGEWLAGQLRTAGANVSVDHFEVAAVLELSETPVLEWSGHRGMRVLVHRRDFAEHLRSASLPTVQTGLLGAMDDQDWNGRWIVAATPQQRVLQRAWAEGAVGLLVPRGVDEAGWMPKMIAGPGAASVPILSVRTDLHLEMAASSSRGDRASGSVPLQTVAATGTNICGLYTKSRPGAVSVLLTAHRDGVGDDLDQRLPAAADNASGVAVMMEAARLLALALPDGVGLAVALLDAEEVGAWGSAHHAPQVSAGTYVINVDGAAQLREAVAVEAGGPAEPLLSALDQAGRQVGVPLRAGPMPSDNRRYAAAGLPAIGIGMGMPGYQTPAETPDRVEPATLLAATRLIVATVQLLAAAA